MLTCLLSMTFTLPSHECNFIVNTIHVYHYFCSVHHIRQWITILFDRPESLFTMSQHVYTAGNSFPCAPLLTNIWHICYCKHLFPIDHHKTAICYDLNWLLNRNGLQNYGDALMTQEKIDTVYTIPSIK